jgi:hypothetical protein
MFLIMSNWFNRIISESYLRHELAGILPKKLTNQPTEIYIRLGRENHFMYLWENIWTASSYDWKSYFIMVKPKVDFMVV